MPQGPGTSCMSGCSDFQSTTLSSTLKQDNLKLPYWVLPSLPAMDRSQYTASKGRGDLWQEAHHTAALTSGPRAPSTKPIIKNLEDKGKPNQG